MVELRGTAPRSSSSFELLQRYNTIYTLVLGVCQPSNPKQGIRIDCLQLSG